MEKQAPADPAAPEAAPAELERQLQELAGQLQVLAGPLGYRVRLEKSGPPPAAKPAPRHFRMTERDIAILQAVNRYRYLQRRAMMCASTRDSGPLPAQIV